MEIANLVLHYSNFLQIKKDFFCNKLFRYIFMFIKKSFTKY